MVLIGYLIGLFIWQQHGTINDHENDYIINNELRTISNGKLFQFNHRTLR